MTERLVLPEGVELELLPMEPQVLLRGLMFGEVRAALFEEEDTGTPTGNLEVEVSYLDYAGERHHLAEVLAEAADASGVTLDAVHDSVLAMVHTLRMARHAQLHPEHVQVLEA